MSYLKKIVALDQTAADFGFKWESAQQIIEQIKSEVTEVNVHLADNDRKKLQEEIGDLLHAVFSLCCFCQFDPEETINKSVDKFERRFKLVKQITNQQGLTSLNGKSFKDLMAIWDKAKELESNDK